MATPSARLHSVLSRFEQGRWQLAAIFVALLLTSPVLFGDFALDDFILRAQLEHAPSIEGAGSGPLDLFVFADGDVARNQALMDRGAGLPWWTHPEAKGAFFRPLTSLTHWLDAALWPGLAWAQYAHSLVWFAVVLLAARWVYLRLGMRPWVVGVAVLIFALDEAHGSVVGWIANRNSLIATACALIALAAHHQASRERPWRNAALALMAFALGLAATEFAVGVLGYLVAHALLVDERPAKVRFLSLLPYAGVVLGWRVAYSAMGYGAYGLGSYIDPVGDTGRFLAVLPFRVTQLLSSQLGGPSADFEPLLPAELAPALLLVAAVGLGVAAWALYPTVRSDKRMQFWAIGAALAAVPVSATWASDRLLWFVGLGVAPIVAAALDAGLRRGLWSPGHRVRGVLLGAFALAHLVAAPAQLPVRATSMSSLGQQVAKVDASLPSLPEVENQTFVLLDPPVSVYASYLQVRRAVHGDPRPKHLYWLAPRTSEVEITRLDEKRLRVRTSAGFLNTTFERHYRDPKYEMPIGHRVELSEVTIEVIELTDDGRPRACDFVFRESLDAARYRFFRWKELGFVPHQVLKVGETLRLAPIPLIDVMLGGK